MIDHERGLIDLVYALLLAVQLVVPFLLVILMILELLNIYTVR